MPNEPSSTYKVKSGDTLGRIATRHGVTLDALRAANPQLTNPNKIKVGQVIHIPSAGATPPPVSEPAPEPIDTQPTVTPRPAPPGAFPDTAGMSEAEKFRFYADFFAARGVPLPALQPNQRILLGLRASTTFNANDRGGRYDDRLVVAWTDSAGNPRVREFIFNTEPSGLYEDRFGRDADNDNRPDLGCLQDGQYSYSRTRHRKFGRILKPDQNIIVRRDTTHDGLIDERDDARVRNRSRLDSLRTMYFHIGARRRTGSSGCQTIQPDDFESFWRCLGTQQTFTYFLTTIS